MATKIIPHICTKFSKTLSECFVTFSFLFIFTSFVILDIMNCTEYISWLPTTFFYLQYCTCFVSVVDEFLQIKMIIYVMGGNFVQANRSEGFFMVAMVTRPLDTKTCP
jgi:hypothetical protein